MDLAPDSGTEEEVESQSGTEDEPKSGTDDEESASGTDDEDEPAILLSELGELRRELQGELEGLVEKRSEVEEELQALGKEIEAKQRELGLVKATVQQLVAQELRQQELEGDGPGASKQVRGSRR
jgi:hypothetical protein